MFAGTELWCHGGKAHVYNEPNVETLHAITLGNSVGETRGHEFPSL